MEGVQFDEEDNLPRRSSQRRFSLLTRFVMRIGLAKDERQAQYILLIIAIIAIVLTFLLFPESNSAVPLTAPAAT